MGESIRRANSEPKNTHPKGCPIGLRHIDVGGGALLALLRNEVDERRRNTRHYPVVRPDGLLVRWIHLCVPVGVLVVVSGDVEMFNGDRDGGIVLSHGDLGDVGGRRGRKKTERGWRVISSCVRCSRVLKKRNPFTCKERVLEWVRQRLFETMQQRAVIRRKSERRL